MSIINSVKYLQNVKFNHLPLQEKLAIKQGGRPTPNLQISRSAKSRDKQYTRQFNASVYQRYEWICGCEHSNALFCFPCLLFGYDNSDYCMD